MASQGDAWNLRDKEMSAVSHNIMEQRVLEKSLQTLKLEQSYALKLLELDNRVIKVHYKKLKERVSKIKSHLPAEDISKFRDLDMKGKLKPAYGGMSLSSAVKIAAASRRLNLNDGRSSSRRNIRSALPRIAVPPDNHHQQSKPKRFVPDRMTRSNSVTGVFIDAPHQNKSQRPRSASVVQPSTGSLLSNGRDHMDSVSIQELNMKNTPNGSTTASTQNLLAVPNGDTKEMEVPVERHPVHIRASTGLKRTHTPFSSHTTAEKDARAGLNTAPAQYSRSRRLSHDSIDSNLGESIFEERRQELLEEENVRAATLDKRTKNFLKDVEEYLQKNPPLQAPHVAFENPPPEPPAGTNIEVNNTRRPMRMRRNEIDYDETPTFLPEFKYKERLLTLWKDMNKCRYLRLPDERIDLSGINTLVKDQMKLFEALKNADLPPLKQAWET